MDQVEQNSNTHSSPHQSINAKALDSSKFSYRKSKEPSINQETISFRKRPLSSVNQEEEENQTLLYSKVMKNQQKIPQHFVWKKRGKVKTEQITNICDITAEKQLVNVEGQIIFIWTKKELLNLVKFPDENYRYGEIYDGSGSIIICMPTIFLPQQQALQNGKSIKILKAKIKRNGKQKAYLVFTNQSILEKSHKKLVFEPEKFAITVKELLDQPAGLIRNVMGIVIQHRQNVEIVKKANGEELMLSKIILYDPEDNSEAEIKLWEQKTKIKFYNSVYMLRGIQIKEYKGKREYSATKDFTYRALVYGKIQNSLRPAYEERQKLLRNKPIKTVYRTVSKACALLREQPEEKVVWSIIECNVIQFAYESYETFKYSLCSVFDNKVMISADKEAKCFYCLKSQNDDQNHEYHYAIKMQFQDAYSQFYAECHDEAVLKLFSESQTETVPLCQYEQMTLEMRELISKRLSGNIIHGLFATIREIYGQYELFYHYLIDLIPMPEEE